MPRIAAVNQDKGISPGRNKGAAVHLVAMRDAFSSLGADVIALDLTEDRKLQQSLLALHQDSPVQLIYERYALGKSTAAHFASKNDIPLVLEVNAPLAQEQERFRGKPESDEERENDRYLFCHADCIVAVSNAVAAYARSRGARPDSIMVCPNGIDTNRFNLQVDGGQTRNTLFPGNQCVLGFHGRLRPWHGFEQLVSVFSRLLKQQLPVHLFVIGEGDFQTLSQLPGDSYTQLGWQAHEHIPSLIAAFDILPLSYQPDMPCYFSPLKLMEAMACGVVPVVPDLGDLSQTIKHGETGIVYPAGDLEALEACLKLLITRPLERQRIGRLAGTEAARHSWQAIARLVMQQVSLDQAKAGLCA